MKKIILPILLLLFLQLSCKENGLTPPDNKPPGWQEDIPWPSLADSPWPMNHADPQNTGRSKSNGPSLGRIGWIFNNIYSEAGIAIGADSIIYFTSSGSGGDSGKIYAINFDGTLKWTRRINISSTTPTVCADGTILAAGGSHLYAFNNDGTEKWRFYPAPLQRSIYVGKDGTIYSLADQTLYAIDKNGSLIWQYQTAGGWGSKFVFSPDGKTLYSYYYTGIISFDIESKTENWRFGNGRVHAALVDSKGNININIEEGNQFKNYSLTESGEIRWEFLHNELCFEMTMDNHGNLFFGVNALYSLDYNGQMRFSIPLAGSSSDLVSDIEGNIYIVRDTRNYKLEIRSYTNTGSLRWNLVTEQNTTSGFCSAIAFNKLIIPTWESEKFYSIE